MKRIGLVVLFLLLLAGTAAAVWFVSEGGSEPERATETAPEDTPAPEEAAPEPEATESAAGRDRVRPEAPEPERANTAAWTLTGRVVDQKGEPVRGAAVHVYAVGAGAGRSAAVDFARQRLGDVLDDEDLEFLDRERRTGGLGFGMAVDFGVEEEIVEIETELNGIEGELDEAASDDVEVATAVAPAEAMADRARDGARRGMRLASRLMAREGGFERMLSVVQHLAAGFEDAERLGDAKPLATATSAADGTFKVEGLELARVEVRASAPRFAQGAQRATPEAPRVHIALPLAGTVVGRVVDPDGAGIAGASVRSRQQDVQTDGSGAFRIEGAISPRESLLATAEGYRAAGTYADVPAEGESEEVVIELHPAGAVEGVVVDGKGRPIAGASVMQVSGTVNFMSFMSLADQSTLKAPGPVATTDASGRFLLDGLVPGQVTLLGTARGYLPLRHDPVEVRAHETTGGVKFALVAESVLVGTVRGEDGATLAGASIAVAVPATGPMAQLAAMMGSPEVAGASDETGGFRVGGLPAGTHQVTVKADGYRQAKASIEFAAEETTKHDFRLAVGHRVSGSVVGDDGNTVAGARVSLEYPSDDAMGFAAMFGGGEEEGRTTTTDGNGQFTFEGLDDGPYTVSAQADEWLPASVEGVQPGSTDTVLRLPSAAILRGVVTGPDGSPVGGAWVARTGGSSDDKGPMWMQMMSIPDQVMTDADGRFEMTGLAPGDYTLKAERQGFANSDELKVSCGSGEVVDDIRLILEIGASLSGRVVDSAGLGVEGAVVWISDGDNPWESMVPNLGGGAPSAPSGSVNTTTDATGAFVLEGATPGRVTLHARSARHAPAKLADIEVPGPTVVVQMSAGGGVEGRVTDDDGAPKEGVSVMLMGGGGMSGMRTATTDPNGDYSIPRIVPGSYTLMLMDAGSGTFGMDGGVPVTIVEGEVTRHDFGPDDDSSTITGTVKRGESPLGGAVVMLTSSAGGMKMAAADGSGSFTFDNVAPGRYTVMAQTTMMGGGSTRARITVGPGENVPPVNLVLSTLSVTGKVVDAETGEGVAMAQVILMKSDTRSVESLDEMMGAHRGQAITGPDGSFTMDGVDAGTYTLRVTAADYVELSLPGVSAGGGAVTARLSGGSVLKVTVLTPDGTPASGATVVRVGEDGSESISFSMSMQGMADENGVATLRLPPGPHRLSAESATFPRIEFQADGSAGETTVRLPKGADLLVIVTDAGQPVTGAEITLLDADGKKIAKRLSAMNFMGTAATTDSGGRLRRTGVPPGEVTVLVDVPGGRTKRVETSVRAGETAELPISMSE